MMKMELYTKLGFCSKQVKLNNFLFQERTKCGSSVFLCINYATHRNLCHIGQLTQKLIKRCDH